MGFRPGCTPLDIIFPQGWFSRMGDAATSSIKSASGVLWAISTRPGQNANSAKNITKHFPNRNPITIWSQAVNPNVDRPPCAGVWYFFAQDIVFGHTFWNVSETFGARNVSGKSFLSFRTNISLKHYLTFCSLTPRRCVLAISRLIFQ